MKNGSWTAAVLTSSGSKSRGGRRLSELSDSDLPTFILRHFQLRSARLGTAALWADSSCARCAPLLLLPWSSSLLLFSSPLLPDSNQSDRLSYGAASRCKNNRNNFSRPHGSGDRLWRHWRMQNGKIRIWLCCGVCCLSGETHVFVCQIWIMCLIICRLLLWCCSRRSAASPLRYEARSCFRGSLYNLPWVLIPSDSIQLSSTSAAFFLCKPHCLFPMRKTHLKWSSY